MKKLDSQSTLEGSQIAIFKEDDLTINHHSFSLNGAQQPHFYKLNDKIAKPKKNVCFRQSVEKQVTKMQEIYQKIKLKAANNKTCKILQSQALEPAIKQTSFSKQRSFQKRQGFSIQKTTPLQTYINEPKKPISIPSILSTQHPKRKKVINHLKEIREIQSFVLEDNEVMQISNIEWQGSISMKYQGEYLGEQGQPQFTVLKLIEERLFEKTLLVQSKMNNSIYTVKSIKKITMDQDKVNQLISQCRIQLFLNHINILKLYHVLGDSTSVFFLLEACSGKTLFQRLKEIGRMEESDARELIRQLCTGVQYMHERGIAHGQISSKNIFLQENIIKLTNFQRAVYYPLKKHKPCLTTRENLSHNTKEQQYHKKKDILSIGALTYELLYGSAASQIIDLEQIAMTVKSTVLDFPHNIQTSETAEEFITICIDKNSEQSQTIQQLSKHSFLKKLDKTDKYRWTMI